MKIFGVFTGSQAVQRLTLVLISLLLAVASFMPPAAQAQQQLDTIKIASYNAHIDLSGQTVVRDIRRINKATQFQVIAVQENYHGARRATMIKQLTCDTCAYRSFSVKGRGKSELMIFYKWRQLSMVDKGVIKTAEPYKELGKNRAAMYLMWARFEYTDTNGVVRQFILGNNHLPSLLDRNDTGRPNCKKFPKRCVSYKSHMKSVEAKINSWKQSLPGVPIFMAGDYNVNYRVDSKVKHWFFPYKSFQRVGGVSNWQVSSYASKYPNARTFIPQDRYLIKHKRLIDYIFTVPNGTQVTQRSTRILTKNMHSDHHAVITGYRISDPAQ